MSAGEGARTYTFLYTDIVGSSRLWESDPHAMASAVEAHNALIEAIVEESGGRVFKSLGDGLACVFDAADRAVACAVSIQRGISGAELACPIEIRIGIHSGTAHAVGRDFGGPVLNRVSRITDLAGGGQVIVSEAARNLALDYLDATLAFEALGTVPLEGMARPESVFAISAEGVTTPTLFVAEDALPPTNLEPLDRPFIGRRDERSDLCARLRGQEQRLITVVGFGGIGKTTLARQCGLDVLDHFDGHVYWVECEALRTREDLIAAILESIGQVPVNQESDSDLLAVIGVSSLLLICDCFENIITLGGLLDRLIRLCPNLRILITSRIVVGAEAEYLLELPGMDGKRRGAMESDAVELFRSQAKRHSPTFGARAPELALARKIVKKVDFVPLAIIICAGRLRDMRIESLHEMVQDSLLSTVRTFRDAAGRHSGLAKVIKMSFDLLAEEDQNVLQGLAVFDGSFDLPAARAVLTHQVAQMDDSIFRLRDHSLISRQDRSRYRLLDSVREFLLEHMSDPAKMTILREAHRDHFLDYIREIGTSLASTKWSEAVSLWKLEAPNLRLALRTSLETDVGVGEFAGSFSRVMLELGEHALLDELCSSALEKAKLKGDVATEINLLGQLGTLMRRRGNHRLASELFNRRALRSRQLENWVEVADSLCDLAVTSLEAGEMINARKAIDEVLALGHAASNNQYAALAYLSLIQARSTQVQESLEVAAIVEEKAHNDDDVLLSLGHVLGEVYRISDLRERSFSILARMLRVAAMAERPASAEVALLQIALACEQFHCEDLIERVVASADNLPNRRSQIVTRLRTRRNTLHRAPGRQSRTPRSWQLAANEIADLVSNQ